MKTVKQKMKWPGVITSVALLAFMFTSCSKDYSNNTSNSPTANMAVIDVSPTAPSLDFYLGGTRVNSSSIIYGGGLVYFTCYSGSRQAAFYQTGTSTQIAADTVNLAANGIYTLLLSNVPSTPDVTLIRDSIYAPSSGAATLRLINASPDAGGVDVGFRGHPVFASNILYRKNSAFMPITLSTITNDTLLVYRTGTTTVLQKVAVNMQAGGVYTAFIYGFVSQTATNEQLNINLMENTYYQ